MWSTKDGKVRLDITKVSENFNIVSDKNLHLVYPRRNLWEWKEKEKWLRSIIVDDDGFVVSCSWKKFGNYDEFKNDTHMLNKSLKNGVVRFTNKEDGSLCIRSVVNNEVILRTRGTIFGIPKVDDGEKETFAVRFKEVAKNKYPILLDNSFLLDRSLMFEYVSPDNVIVIPYLNEDLIFLGFVIHKDLRIGTWEEMELLASNNKFNLVKINTLPNDPELILKEIETWKTEGIVARCNNDQTFVKIKSAHYLANHRMKFLMSDKSIANFAEDNNVNTEEELVENLFKFDYDWEIIQIAKEYFKKYLEVKETRSKIIKEATRKYEKFKKKYHNDFWVSVSNKTEKTKYKQLAETARKEYAQLANSQPPYIKTLMFLIYDNNTEKLNKFYKKKILSELEKIK